MSEKKTAARASTSAPVSKYTLSVILVFQLAFFNSKCFFSQNIFSLSPSATPFAFKVAFFLQGKFIKMKKILYLVVGYKYVIKFT